MLDVSRGRIYQIINSLPPEQKPKKNKDGNFILDDKAVQNIRAYFIANTVKDENRSSDEQIAKMTEQLNTLRKQNIKYERQIDADSKQIELQKELIETLKKDNQTLTDQLKIKDEQIERANQLAKEAHTLTDQAQKLNAVDKKQKEIEHSTEKKSIFSSWFGGNKEDKNN